jgi:hypothetical protein
VRTSFAQYEGGTDVSREDAQADGALNHQSPTFDPTVSKARITIATPEFGLVAWVLSQVHNARLYRAYRRGQDRRSHKNAEAITSLEARPGAVRERPVGSEIEGEKVIGEENTRSIVGESTNSISDGPCRAQRGADRSHLQLSPGNRHQELRDCRRGCTDPTRLMVLWWLCSQHLSGQQFPAGSERQ